MSSSPREWKEQTLGEVLTFQRGFDITRTKMNRGPFEVISSAGVSGYHDEYKVKGPGVVIGRKGTLGTVHYTSNNYWPSDTTLWVKNFHGNDERFAYYFLQTLHLESYDVGAANPTLNRNHIHLLKVRYPPIHVQKAISSILSAYDNLIENNRRRIQLLKEMASGLYREWFVHFRFPGHEDIEMVDSELGEIPGSWEVTTVGNVFGLIIGGTPSKKRNDYWNGGNINWHRPSEITSAGSMFIDESEMRITSLGLERSSAKLIPQRSVIMTAIGTIGAAAINATPATTNQNCITCIPNERISSYHIYFWILENSSKLDAMASGAAYKILTKTVMKEIEFLLPPQHLETKFERTCKEYADLILNLVRMDKVLSRTRDMLLPKLVSGQLDVSDLKLDIPTDTRKTSKYSDQSTLDQWQDGDEDHGRS